MLVAIAFICGVSCIQKLENVWKHGNALKIMIMTCIYYSKSVIPKISTAGMKHGIVNKL